MTESSSAGHPDGAGLPADHPLGPADPVPPREKEESRTGGKTGRPGAAAGDADDDRSSGAPGMSGGSDGNTDGPLAGDRRESVLDPGAGRAGSAEHDAANIRDEQGTHSAGTVPAAFNGAGSPEAPEDDREPEQAAAEPDSWDSGGTRG